MFEKHHLSLSHVRRLKSILLSLGLLVGSTIAHDGASGITPTTITRQQKVTPHRPKNIPHEPRNAIAPHQISQHTPSPRILRFPNPERFPVEMERLTAESSGPSDGVLTSTIISPSGLTPPSLWWTQQQIGDKVLQGWIAYSAPNNAPPYVDLIVNRQLWGISDYLERYSFVHHFGHAAAAFGYAIRVFNNVGDYLAAYPCPDSFSHMAHTAGWNETDRLQAELEISSSNDREQHSEPSFHPHTCSIIVDSSGIAVRRNNDFSGF